MIEQQEKQIQQLQQLDDIQDSDMIQKLTQDSAAKTTIAPSSVSSTSDSSNLDLQKLRDEKEEEIKVIVQSLEAYKGKIDTLKANYEKDTSLKQVITEETKELAENLKTVSKNNKKFKEIKQELDKLEN